MKERTLKILLIGICSLFLNTNFLYSASPKRIEIKFFFSPTCRHCLKIKKEFLPKIEERYKGLIRIEYLNVREQKNHELFLSLLKGAKRKAVPTVVIGDKYLVGANQIKKTLPLLIEYYLKNEAALKKALSKQKIERMDIKKFFSSFGVWTILWAGFIDGFNPCAFGVIIFFVSFLSLCGYKKEMYIYVGSSYILAVYLSYLLIGLGLFKFLYYLNHFYIFMKIFYMFLAGLCFFLAFLSLGDYFRLKKENVHFSLSLPEGMKKFIDKFSACSVKAHSLITKFFKPIKEQELTFLRKLKLIIIAFFVGLCVSILECACTGQVYLPTISLCLKLPSLRAKSFLYLVLYNVMFIIPLVIVFVFALKGLSSEKFSNFSQKHMKLIRLLLAGLFISLGIMIIIF